MSYLINEPPLVLSPTLAALIGLNEAIVLQQMQYWLNKSDKVKDGRTWIYNTYEEWCEQFPFWSKATIKRTILNLESNGFVISANYNKSKFDKTKWYTIDYSKLSNEYAKMRPSDCGSSWDHDSINLTPPKKVANWDRDSINLTPPIPDNTTDTNTDNTTDIYNNVGNNPTDVFEEIINYLNEKTGTKYRVSSKKTKSLINARMREGFTVEDFKEVIDKKVFNWMGTKWSSYLRPETLFGSKFESYLNEQIRGYGDEKFNANNRDYDSTGRKLL